MILNKRSKHKINASVVVRPVTFGDLGVYVTDGNNRAEVVFEGTEDECYDWVRDNENSIESCDSVYSSQEYDEYDIPYEYYDEEYDNDYNGSDYRYTAYYDGNVFYGDSEEGYNTCGFDRWEDAYDFYMWYSDVLDIEIYDNVYGVVFRDGDWW